MIVGGKGKAHTMTCLGRYSSSNSFATCC